MARKPSPKPKHVAHTKRGQKHERTPRKSPSHQSIAELDAKRLAFEAATAPYVPAPLPIEARQFVNRVTYRPEHCQMILDDAALGHTLGATAAVIGVTRSTLHDWVASHPELGDAIARAKSVRQRFYEGHAIDIARRGGDSTRMSAIKLGLLNVGGEDWKERLTAEHNVTFSLASLVKESMQLAQPDPKLIEGEVIEPSKDDGDASHD